MRKCPFCAEMIQDEAVKCRFCGEALVSAQPVTAIREERTWRTVTWHSDGSPRALLDLISSAVQAAGYPISERSLENLTLKFESTGWTLTSTAGERVTVSVSSAPGGSSAFFSAKSKPKGMARLESGVSAAKWVDRLKPGIADVRITA